MATCPNTNLDSWKTLVAARGEDMAYYLWDKHQGNVPSSEYEMEKQEIVIEEPDIASPIVRMGLKSVNALQSEKAINLFKTLEKNKVKGDAFWNKIQSDLQIPKEQMDLLKQYNTTNREELIANMLANYSYTVEINTAKDASEKAKKDSWNRAIEQGLNPWEEGIDNDFQGENTQIYSNLTVLGGTNYTEQEIATPAITPSIKGHAQFATDKGIGWFRSDDKVSEQKKEFSDLLNQNKIEDAAKLDELRKTKDLPTKTRRILEVQSDLFQKGRDKENLIDKFERDEYSTNEFVLNGDSYKWVGESFYKNDEYIYKSKYDKALQQYLDQQSGKNKSENQFLQLLNKGGNWVTFFTKSIIQDSAKKGYEKVLFPSGNTASKVEGHTTLEEFKKQKEDRIKELENRIASDETITDVNSIPINKFEILDNKGETIGFRKLDGKWNIQYMTGKTAFQEQIATDEQVLKGINKVITNRKEKDKNEINQLKQELERVEIEGFGALKPIYNFYENTVANVLKKQGYNPLQITDEYGNTWNEISIKPVRDVQPIMLQLEGALVSSKASPRVMKLIRQLIKSIGVDFASVSNIVVNGKKVDAQGVADIVQKLIQVVEGKEDVTLPEETMHFVVEIIQQTNPKLFNQLMKEINNYTILNQVFKDYGNNPYYQKDGKPDVIKLKKEAIAKVLVETVINKTEGFTEKPELLSKSRSWWRAILDWLKSLITASGFDQAALKIMSGESIGTVEDIRSDEIYLSETTRDVLYNRLVDINNKISKDDDNPDEKKRGYYINGVKVLRRVTDLVSDWYQRRFAEKDLLKGEFQKAIDDLKAEKGTMGHKDMENAFHLYVDDNGFLRDAPLNDDVYKSHLNEEDRTMYEALRDNLRDRLYSFGKETRFLSEVMVYDQRRKIAGTIDFVAIDKDGNVNLLDWKFVDLKVTDKETDIPWYKIRAWRQQMEQYKLILSKAYGVKEDKFKQTRMIPIKAYYSQPNYKEKVLPRLEKIEIGNVDVALIEENYLIPVGLEEETTGMKDVDDLIKKLNALYDRLSEQRATSEAGKKEKSEQLNSLFSAIRQLQMKKNVAPLINQAKLLNKLIEKMLATYEDSWKDAPISEKSDAAIDNMYEQLNTLNLAAQKTYSSLNTDLYFLFEKTPLSEEDEKLKKELDDVSYATTILAKKMDGIENDFVEKFIVNREKSKDILKPEKVIKNLASWFASTSTVQTTAIQTLFKKANRVLAYAAQDAINETRRISEIEKDYNMWALTKGLTTKDYFKYIKKKDKNELIDEFDVKFYKGLKQAVEDKNYEWIIDNVDVNKAKEAMKERLQFELDIIEKRITVSEADERKKNIDIENAKNLYNVDTPTSPGWLVYDVIKKVPRKDKWETEEWKELNRKNDAGEYVNKPALDFYNYIKERNEYFQSIGYITKKEARVFLPFVRKTLMEKVVMGGKISLGEQFLRAISIDEGDIGYGKRDPLSGEMIDTVPIYLTKDIDGELSENLFKNMSLYNELAIKYHYLKTIEYQTRALENIERKKKSIATSAYGNTVYKDGVLQFDERNDENTKLLQRMRRGIVYQQKYIQDENFDQILAKLGNFGEKLNKKLGMQIFPENLTGRQVTLNKVWDQVNNLFQMNALGLNALSALSNYMGGAFQSVINAGKYYTKTEFEKNILWFTASKLTGRKSPAKHLAAIEYFLPLTENYNREFAKTLSLNKLTQESIQEFMMVLMRNGDWLVQTANFFSFLENSIVVDGQVVNAREYLKQQPEYADMYAGTNKERKERERKYEEDVKKIIEEKGVLSDNSSKLNDNGTLEIIGVDRKSDSVIELRRKVQSLTKDALGNLSEDDIRQINLLIYGKSFMIFKNWIPRPIDVRMGNLKYNAGSDAYEWGRMRMVYRMLSWKLWESLTNMKNALEANDKGVDYMRKLWEKKRQEYKEDTNKDLEMTESQFMDLVRHNIRSATYDVVIMLTLAAIVFGLKAYEPEEDEESEAVRNYYKFLVRAMDKLRDELLYFYDPTSLMSTVSSGLFPSLSYITNFMKLFKNFMIENYAIAMGDEPLEEKNQVIKYLMKSFPITSAGVGYLPMFYPELAKDLGIRATTESRPLGF